MLSSTDRLFLLGRAEDQHGRVNPGLTGNGTFSVLIRHTSLSPGLASSAAITAGTSEENRGDALGETDVDVILRVAFATVGAVELEAERAQRRTLRTLRRT